MTNKIDMCGGEDCLRLEDAKTRADDLSRMVAAMGEVFERLLPYAEHAMQPESHAGPCGFESCDGICVDNAHVSRAMHDAQDILSRPDVVAERGRWVPMADFERSGAKAVVAMAQRDAAIARADALADCGQSEGCAISPPCCRHLTEQLDEMEAVAERWEDRCGHQTARADDLSRTVAAMADAVDGLIDMEKLTAILSRPDVTAERGRWRRVDEVIAALTKAGLALGVHSTMDLDTHIKRVREDFDAIANERDDAIARAEKAEARLAHRIVACADRCAQNMPGLLYSGLTYVDDVLWCVRILSDEAARDADARDIAGQKAREALAALAVLSGDPALDKMTPEQVVASAWARVLDAERARDELGIQIAAQSERLRLAMAVVDASRDASSYAGQLRLDAALEALDAVPGDALVNGVKVVE